MNCVYFCYLLCACIFIHKEKTIWAIINKEFSVKQ